VGEPRERNKANAYESVDATEMFAPLDAMLPGSASEPPAAAFSEGVSAPSAAGDKRQTAAREIERLFIVFGMLIVLGLCGACSGLSALRTVIPELALVPFPATADAPAAADQPHGVTLSGKPGAFASVERDVG
jgi:hypothetical protein